MIIRNNLASVPVKNYFLYVFGCIALTVTAVIFTGFNVAGLRAVRMQSKQLERRIDEQQTYKTRLGQEASSLQGGIARIKTAQFIKETDFINNVIKRRAFSWTRLFDAFENTLPDNVRMVSVIPSFTEDGIMVSMEVAGRSLEDMVKFYLIMENSSSFKRVVFRGEREEADGLLHASMTAQYLPEEQQKAALEAGTQPVTKSAPVQGKKEQ